MPTFFDYFQIASVVIVVAIIAGRAMYLRAARNINPIVIGGGKKGARLAAEIAAIAGLLIWMIEILLYALHSSLHIFPAPFNTRLLNSPAAAFAGVILIIVGLVIFILAYVSFGDSWRVGFDVKSPGPLVTSGMFAITRNPIYLFLDLWFVGIFLINGTLIFLVLAVAAIAFQHWQILQEEDFLRKLYGEPYRAYCSRTPRYLIW